MESILYSLVMFIARIHAWLMNINNVRGYNYTDKQLHFIVIGLLGGAMVLILHPIFLWLSRRGMTIVITFLYVFTVLVGITFAIEIGQGLTGTGNMEFGDIVSGLTGFLVVFVIYCIGLGIFTLLKRGLGGGREQEQYGRHDRQRR